MWVESGLLLNFASMPLTIARILSHAPPARAPGT